MCLPISLKPQSGYATFVASDLWLKVFLSPRRHGGYRRRKSPTAVVDNKG